MHSATSALVRPPAPDLESDPEAAPGRHEDLSDEALALALIAGSVRAPRLAWTRFAPMVRRILARTFGPRQDVEDLLQEIFLTFFRKVPGLRQPASLKAFVVSITVRTIKHELRSRRARRFFRLLEDEAEPDTRYTEQPDLTAHEAFMGFYRILDHLPAADQAAFSLRFFEEFELPEVARALGVSVSTAKRRLARIWKLVAARVRQSPALFAYFSRRCPGEADQSAIGSTAGS